MSWYFNLLQNGFISARCNEPSWIRSIHVKSSECSTAHPTLRNHVFVETWLEIKFMVSNAYHVSVGFKGKKKWPQGLEEIKNIILSPRPCTSTTVHISWSWEWNLHVKENYSKGPLLMLVYKKLSYPDGMVLHEWVSLINKD